jgi:hypothetical protein
MSLSSSFWTTGYADIRVQHDFSSAGHLAYRYAYIDSGSPTEEVYISEIQDVYGLRQLSSMGSVAYNSEEHGKVYAVNTTDSTDVRPLNWVRVMGGEDWTNPAYIWSSVPTSQVYIDPGIENVEKGYPFPPVRSRDTSDDSTTIILKYIRSNTSTANDTPVSDSFYVRHFQPYTYYGNPSEVIAAIMLHLGADEDSIDKDAFSNADTGLAAMTDEPKVLVTREVGETIAETIRRVARHSNDILCVSMAGKIALVSRSLPPAGPTSLTPSDLIGGASVRYAREHITNHSFTSFGEWLLFYYTDDTLDTQQSRYDRFAEWDLDGVLTNEISDTTSIAKYGDIIQTNVEQDQRIRNEDGSIVDGILRKVQRLHFPYFYDEDCRDAVMERLTDVESTLRREIEIKQDLRGLDFDIGYELTGIEVTGDGDTITATCIEKEIDFQNLTVKSKLLEEPS